ncbi:hypothetical protein QTG56_25590 (plasmid) [Rossellomorea sp. AcN35-11]|nr:hypothetical protein [Rossellomorea aquimaris]WJV31989.1 hypothetical protein QTG56_25590 [Rossellomorea sp. AcN35-11]
MVKDKFGKEVYEGDTIRFVNSGINYKIINKDGLLGAYENGEFISLKEVLRNFIVISS